MNGLFVAFILTLTVSLATALGITAAYAAVNGILYVFSQQARPPRPSAPVMATGSSPAGGD
ncbi:MAG TPA: hypothetical protein VMH85_07625 [Terriglobales bacterium]|nr:hypothetical protein [Terriglobales bacterium]